MKRKFISKSSLIAIGFFLLIQLTAFECYCPDRLYEGCVCQYKYLNCSKNNEAILMEEIAIEEISLTRHDGSERSTEFKCTNITTNGEIISENLLKSLRLFYFYSVRHITIDSCPVSVMKLLGNYSKIYDKFRKLKIKPNGAVRPGDYLIYISGMRRLDLGGNNLTIMPENIFENNTELVELELSGRDLIELPEMIFKNLTNLKKLVLNRNKLTQLPRNIFQNLKNLKELGIYENQLTTLPEDIFMGPSGLEILVFEEVPLTSLPENIFNGLINLRFLILFGNKITTLPNGIFDSLRSLKTLALIRTNLTTLPENIFQNQINLRLLELSDNRLKTIPEFAFDTLTNLQWLNLSFNSLTTLPEGILKRQNNLTEIYLDHNELTALPGHIFNSSTFKLNTFALNHNQLTTLPKTIFNGFNGTDPKLLLNRIVYNPWLCDCDFMEICAKHSYIFCSEANHPKCADGVLVNKRNLTECAMNYDEICK